jgi:xylose dehydrogenase (NAD/NADP)
MTGLRWGILGASSRIATKAVVPALEARGHQVVAGASRAADGGFGDYARLIERDDIDAIYNPLPNAMHAEWTHRSLDAGKHVLCEKPLGMDEAEALSMYEHARSAGRHLIEAYMAPFHPRTELIYALAAQGNLGELQFAHTAFSFEIVRSRADDHRLTALGRGALLDVGIYTVAPLLWLAGDEPVRVVAGAEFNEYGADTATSTWMEFAIGLRATAEVGFNVPYRQRFEVVGTEGALLVDDAFNVPFVPTT